MTQYNQVFITGNSSGLGRGLTEVLLEQGAEVLGCSRRGCDIEHAHLHDVQCDLNEVDTVPPALERLLAEVDRLDLVVLNAGILGEIKPMTETSLAELDRIMQINVWANKVILDWLHGWGKPIRQILLMSSGAAVMGNKGWGGYALSKAALNMLGRLYSHEFPDTHIAAIAPGLIDTAMMDYLCVEPDPAVYPALVRIREARGTPVMPGAPEAARRVLQAAPQLTAWPSGEFIDIRQILAPEEYAALLKTRQPG